VASGSLTIWAGPDQVVLHSGDYHRIPTNVPHTIQSGPEDTHALHISTRPGSPSWSPARAPPPTSSPPTPGPTWSCSWP
jgi:hypothetical protein